MKEFIDNLISRLEENTIQHKESITLFNECGVKFIAVGKVKEIVNELAEEYNKDCCEWKKAGTDSLFYKTCKKVMPYNTNSDKKYCPYCGKKIKVAPYTEGE